MKFTLVGSGSQGNCVIVYSNKQALIIDLGISKKRVEDCLKNYDLALEDVSAFLITHEHFDHTSEAKMAPLEKIYGPAKNVLKDSKGYKTSELNDQNVLKNEIQISIGTFKITPFETSHDCENSFGYLIDDGVQSLVYVTDTGYLNERYYHLLKNKTYYLVESNFDPEMLIKSGRPPFLIHRIQSYKGHMSNTDTAYLLIALMGKKTKQVVLSHISQDCNTYSLAVETVRKVLSENSFDYTGIDIIYATQSKPTIGGDK